MSDTVKFEGYDCPIIGAKKEPERGVEIVREPGDREAELAGTPLTDAEIQENLPEVWKQRAIAARHQVSLPIKGTTQYT